MSSLTQFREENPVSQGSEFSDFMPTTLKDAITLGHVPFVITGTIREVESQFKNADGSPQRQLFYDIHFVTTARSYINLTQFAQVEKNNYTLTLPASKRRVAQANILNAEYLGSIDDKGHVVGGKAVCLYKDGRAYEIDDASTWNDDLK